MRVLVLMASLLGTAFPAVTGAAPAAASSAAPAPFAVAATPAALSAACKRGLARARADLPTLERAKPDARWLRAYDNLGMRIEDASSPLLFLAHVHPDKAMRLAAEQCELQWQDFQSSLNQNPALYRAVRALKPSDAVDRQAQQDLLASFEDAGVGLPPAQRKKAKAMLDQLTALQQQFERNIRDAGTQSAFTEAELNGVPDNVWKAAPRDTQGRVLLGVDPSTFMPFMQSAHDGAARERMYRAKITEGGPANIELLSKIADLRRNYAALFGLPSFADFRLRRAMAQTPQRAAAFLDEVSAAVKDSELRDLEVLRRAKAAHLKQDPAAVKFERWDLYYYEELVRRERYSVDQEAFRPYFPPQQSLEFVMRVVERLMGVRYTRVPGVKLWHDEAQTYVVSDASTGQSLGTMLVDLYPREGKYNHAAVWPLRAGSSATGRPPTAALVVNFDRQGLSLEELETLLHELGHAVHTNLSATRYAFQAGTSVKHDFVEAPSQMLEDWVYDRRVLDLFKDVCAACKPVPDELLAKAVQARDFAKGVQFARQHLYASYDLALYGRSPREPLALWRDMEGATSMGTVQGSLFPSGFAHVATNYGAGYYGYLWSLVVAMDLRTAFTADKLDPAVGRRYRQTVLANGAQRPPDELLRQFLGRDTNAKAFFEHLRK
jgi:thimet oligopeptidase